MKHTVITRLALILLLGCGLAVAVPCSAQTNFKLQVLHASDLEGGVEAIALRTMINSGGRPISRRSSKPWKQMRST